jgi:DNA (cytosine-5)-methyltransferase 1
MSPRRIAAHPQIKGVDLFCGVGGLTHGLIRGGVRIVAGVDLDEHCRFPYEANNRAFFLQQDVKQLGADELQALYGSTRIRLLAGCAPCQPFSTYSRKGRDARPDSKWDLVAEFARLVNAVRPELVTMENVPQLTDHSVFSQFLESLDGYHTSWDIVECAEYGVPQTRRRLVVLASLLGPIDLLSPDAVGGRTRTVREAIGHLPRIRAGVGHKADRLHAACSLSDLNVRRIRASKPGGTWRDWDKALVAKCHTKNSGKTYPSVYGRMEWDAPAPTITTQCFGFGNGRFGHPEQDRAISLREAAILQTFPDDYKFLRPNEEARFNRLGRLIGNAVPVRLGEIVAQSLRTHVQKASSANHVSSEIAPLVAKL